jgi:hypothetical protein
VVAIGMVPYGTIPTIHKNTLQVKSGVIDVPRHLRVFFYEGRHSTLVIILQPQKSFALENNMENHKNVEKYFQNKVGILPQLKLSPTKNVLYPARFWTLSMYQNDGDAVI